MNLLIQQKETPMSIEDFLKSCGIFLTGGTTTKITGREKIDLLIILSDLNGTIILIGEDIGSQLLAHFILIGEETSNSI